MTDTDTQLMKPFKDQQVAIDKLRKVKYRLCGDAMGVGKTVTGIGLDFAMRKDVPDMKDEPCLIVCEKIGLDVWDHHLKAMGVPKEQILMVNPTNRSIFERGLDDLAGFQARRRRSPGARNRPNYRYYIVHWDVLVRIPQLNAKNSNGKPLIQWGHVIADEVHLAKNRKALRTIALKRIATEFKTGLSGTPADDKPWDIWSILHWLYPKAFRSYWRFYEAYVEYKTDGYAGYRVPTGVKNIDQLHKSIDPFYIRRTLREVDPDMPDKIHVTPPVVVKMATRQRREYESMRDKAIALIGASGVLEDGTGGRGGFQLLAPAVIAVLTRLQQMSLATLSPEWDIVDEDWVDADDTIEWDLPKIVLSKPSPKLDAVMNIIQTHEDESFVVFTQFRGMADLIEEECQRLKISCVKIHGGITKKETRTQLVQEFQDGKARVFVGTIAAAGKTITLTRARHVIFTDLSWNPSKNEQAEDRVWRRTQKNAVRIYTIQSEDSIDQVRADRIKQKADWISALMNPKSIR